MKKLLVGTVLALASVGSWAVTIYPIDLYSTISNRVIGQLNIIPWLPDSGLLSGINTYYVGGSSATFFDPVGHIFPISGLVTFQDSTPILAQVSGSDDVDLIGGGYKYTQVVVTGNTWTGSGMVNGTYYNEFNRGIVLYVPEPTTGNLLFLGLTAFGLFRYRSSAQKCQALAP